MGLAAVRRSRGCRSGPVHVEGLRSSLTPAHCRVCPAGRSRRRSAHPRETGIRVFSVIPDGGRSHPLGLEFKQSSLTPAWPNSRTALGPLTLGLTSLHPHAIVPSILSVEGQRIVLPAFFQRGRDSPDKTRQTLATAHRIGPTTPKSIGLIPGPDFSCAPVPRIVSIGQDRSGLRITPGA